MVCMHVYQVTPEMSQADETKKSPALPYRAMDAPSISLNPSVSSNAGIVAYGNLCTYSGVSCS